MRLLYLRNTILSCNNTHTLQIKTGSSLIFSFYEIIIVNKNETKRTIFDTLWITEPDFYNLFHILILENFFYTEKEGQTQIGNINIWQPILKYCDKQLTYRLLQKKSLNKRICIIYLKLKPGLWKLACKQWTQRGTIIPGEEILEHLFREFFFFPCWCSFLFQCVPRTQR